MHMGTGHRNRTAGDGAGLAVSPIPTAGSDHPSAMALGRRLIQLVLIALVMLCGSVWLRPQEGWVARFTPAATLGPLPDTINYTAELERACTPAEVATAPHTLSYGWLDERWHPGPCTMRHFFDGDDDPSSTKALARCLATTKIVLVGDSRVRQLYFYLLAALGRPRHTLDEISVKMHSDLNTTLPLAGRGVLNVYFYWEPALRTDRGVARLLDLGAAAEAAKNGEVATRTLLVQGAGLWELKAEASSSDLILSVEALRAPTAAARRNPALIMYWLPIGGVIWDMLVKPRQTITDEKVAWLDGMVRKILGSELTFLDQVLAIYQGTGPAGTLDGLHYSEKVRGMLIYRQGTKNLLFFLRVLVCSYFDNEKVFRSITFRRSGIAVTPPQLRLWCLLSRQLL